MFTPRAYNAITTDLWSTGVLLANFFAPLTLILDTGDWEERENDYLGETDEDATNAASLQHYIYPKLISPAPLGGAWVRKPIFDASKGEIGLLWSIFRTLGTPNEGSWPVGVSPILTFGYSALNLAGVQTAARVLRYCVQRGSTTASLSISSSFTFE